MKFYQSKIVDIFFALQKTSFLLRQNYTINKNQKHNRKAATTISLTTQKQR